jgi:DNA-binding beta-propeller fold protein YncE
VWVSNGENTVTRVDATTLAIDAPITVGTGPIGLAARAGYVWVANSEDDTVTQIVTGLDNRTDNPRVAKAPVAVAAGAGGDAWVVSQDARRLTHLYLDRGRVNPSMAIATRPRSIAFIGDRVWIAGVEPNVVIGVLRSALGA